jgi:hypothetical protein
MVAKLPSQAPEADSTYETGGEGSRTPVLVAIDADLYMFSRR